MTTSKIQTIEASVGGTTTYNNEGKLLEKIIEKRSEK